MPPTPAAHAYRGTTAFPGTGEPGVTGLGVTAGFRRALTRAVF